MSGPGLQARYGQRLDVVRAGRVLVDAPLVAEHLQIREIGQDQIVEVRDVLADMNVDRHVNRARNLYDGAIGVHPQRFDVQPRKLLRTCLSVPTNKSAREDAER